jgi:hypothetical protein
MTDCDPIAADGLSAATPGHPAARQLRIAITLRDAVLHGIESAERDGLAAPTARSGDHAASTAR